LEKPLASPISPFNKQELFLNDLLTDPFGRAGTPLPDGGAARKGLRVLPLTVRLRKMAAVSRCAPCINKINKAIDFFLCHPFNADHAVP
jgi:hypothetical protein